MFKFIKKRDNTILPFEAEKITSAILNSGKATEEFGYEVAKKLTLHVLNLAQQAINREVPTVEEIQDIVEEVLLSSPFKKSAKAYILYRDQHNKIREIVSNAVLTALASLAKSLLLSMT